MRCTRPLILVPALVLVSCGRPPPEAVGPPSPDLTRAKSAVAELRGALQKALGSALVRDRTSAIAVCARKAPEIAAAITAASPGVLVGRTSHRLRSPSNAPRPWVLPLLEDYRRKERDETPRAVSLPSGGLGYVEPIYTKSMCLTCHGPTLEPGLAARIRQTYPDDQGTGFKEGDLRGLFWAEVRR